jgi:hypothetical protein
MRSRPALAARLASFGMLLALGAKAEPSGAAPASPGATDATEAARAHFKAGVRLYQDQNFAGALAEFLASYELKPGPGSLQNVALCQKALFRYGEAADSLTQLLTLHDARYRKRSAPPPSAPATSSRPWSVPCASSSSRRPRK